jgi:hypothetical protein
VLPKPGGLSDVRGDCGTAFPADSGIRDPGHGVSVIQPRWKSEPPTRRGHLRLSIGPDCTTPTSQGWVFFVSDCFRTTQQARRGMADESGPELNPKAHHAIMTGWPIGSINMITSSDTFIDHNGNAIPPNEATAPGYVVLPAGIAIDDTYCSQPNTGGHYVTRYIRVNGSLPQRPWDWQSSLQTHPLRAPKAPAAGDEG